MKKTFYKIIAAIGAGVPLMVRASSTTIDLPTNFTAQIWTVSSDLFNSFSTYTTTIVGVLLAILVLEAVVGMIANRGKG